MRIRSIKPEFWRSNPGGVFAIDASDRPSWKALGQSDLGGELVYRLYDAQMNLLYVGITWNPFVRWTYHARKKAWWPAVRYASLYQCESERAARNVESVAIQLEHPMRNIHQVRRANATH